MWPPSFRRYPLATLRRTLHRARPCNAASALCYCFLLLLPSLSLSLRAKQSRAGEVPDHFREGNWISTLWPCLRLLRDIVGIHRFAFQLQSCKADTILFRCLMGGPTFIVKGRFFQIQDNSRPSFRRVPRAERRGRLRFITHS